MATGTTYGAWSGVEIREDVLDVIYQITPEDTPMFNLIGDSSATNPLHQWPIRSLTTRADNAVQEGEAFSGNFADLVLPSRVSNLTQIVRKLPTVTRTRKSSTHIGITDLMADQIQQRSVEFKTDVEHALLRGSMNSGSSADATARRMDGFYHAITNNKFDYDSNLTMDEKMINDLVEHVWEDGGRAQDCLVNAKIKRRISEFTDSSTKFIMADERRVINTIGVYESDFHVTNIHLSRDILNATGTHQLTVFDRSFFAKAWLDTPIIERLPRVGDSEDAVIIAELTLEFGNENAAAQYINIANHGIGGANFL
jgi:hypothetical protein